MRCISVTARLALQAAFSADQRVEIGYQLAILAAGGRLVLLVPDVLSIYEPWGLTRYWRTRLSGDKA